MNETSKNEGIQITGGTINARVIAVGKGAKAIINNDTSESNLEIFFHQLSTEDRNYLRQLHENFTTLFSESELRALCFNLGVDYELVNGQNKSEKAIELIKHLFRTERLEELINEGQRQRPNGKWTDFKSSHAIEKQ